MRPVSSPDARPDAPADTTRISRFEVRALLGWAALVLGAVPFLLLWLLVQRSWAPLPALDGDVAADLNAAVSRSPVLVTVLRAVTTLGDTATVVLVFVLATVFLLVRGQRRLAVFAATTGIGLAVLVPLTKAIADRARPVLDSPVVETPSGASFPSGHAMGSLVTATVVLLLVLPAVRRRRRPWLVAATALAVLAVGATRLALGVHFVSDVLAGWALGAAWLAVTTAAFRGWQHESGIATDEPLDPLEIAADRAPRAPWAAPTDQPVLTTALRLLVVAAGLLAVLTALGLTVTRVLGDTWLGRLDRGVAAWAVEVRSPGLTSVADAVDSLSSTSAVLGVGLSLATTTLAVTRSWRPVAFVGVALGGEVLLHVLVSQLVGRPRPAVADLTSELPAAASWPSGHTTAAAALYGAVAAVVLALSRSRWRWAVLAIPLVLAPVVGGSRVYVAAHHLTDVLAGLALGGLWVWACAVLLLPRAGRPRHVRPGARWRPTCPGAAEQVAPGPGRPSVTTVSPVTRRPRAPAPRTGRGGGERGGGVHRHPPQVRRPG